MFCSKCGAENLDAGRFCSQCGAPLTAQPSPSTEDTPETTHRYADLVYQREQTLKRLTNLQGKPRIAWLVLWILLFIAGLFFIVLPLLTEGSPSSCSLLFLISGLCGSVLWCISKLSNLKGEQQCIEILEGIRPEIEPMDAERTKLLAEIQQGNLDQIDACAPYVVPRGANISVGVSQPQDPHFIPQKFERCLLYANNVNFARKFARIATVKTGGGYRVGKVYVPVQKERRQVTGWDKLGVGIFAITNKRVLFLNPDHKITHRLTSIMQLESFDDALAVTKSGRKSADYFIGLDGELAEAIVRGAIAAAD